MKVFLSVFLFVSFAAHADARKKCFPLPTPVVDPPVPSCPKNEIYSECGANGCQSTCENPTLNQVCKAQCIAGCICQEGYVRDSNGKCVLAKNCPQTGEPPIPTCKKAYETYNRCGTACPLTCDKPKPGPCTKQCVAGCFCDAGYVRNDKGNCVPVEKCPKPKCKKFEIFSDCAPLACQKTCDTLNTACRAPCVPGCKCPEGLVYRDDNKAACIAPEDCPVIIVDPPPPAECSKKHESYTDCGTACPLTCENKNGPPITCTMQCVAGCFCDAGYVRDKNGDCVLPEECPAVVPVCKKAHESYSTCGSACPLTCEYPLGRICSRECVKGCFCDEGYIRNYDGDCVLKEDCPKSECGKHETFSDCGDSCQATCKNPSLPKTCKSPCKSGCGCDEGYVREKDKSCVLLKKCQPTLKCGDNEEYDPCFTLACSEPTCDRSEPRSCEAGFCEPKCVCKKGFVRNAEKKCIKSKDCPAPNSGTGSTGATGATGAIGA